MKHIIFYIIPLVLLLSCKKEAQHHVYQGYEYFPTDTGKWVIYKVDSVIWNEFTGLSDTNVCYIKERIQSKFTDNTNKTAQRIERSVRFSDTSSWVVKDVWVSSINETQAEMAEENVRYIKLSFPIVSGGEWNGNALNGLGMRVFKYKDVFNSASINGLQLDSAVTVIERDDFIPLYSRDFDEEIYVKNIGLAFRRNYHVKFRTDGSTRSGSDVIYYLQSHN